MSEPNPDNQRARRILVQRLESLQRAGVQQLRKAPPPVASAPASRPAIAGRPAVNEPVQPIRQMPRPAPGRESEMARAAAAIKPSSGNSLKNEPYRTGLAESIDQRTQAL